MPDQATLDAERIASVAIAAIQGAINVGPLDAIKLKGAFGRYKSDPATKALTIARFIELLCEKEFRIAEQIADGITTIIGD